MPASVASTTRSPASRASTQRGRARRLVALEVGDDPAGDGDPELGGQPAEPAGVLGGDDIGACSSSASRGGASATRPIGVAARTSTPGSRVTPRSWQRDRAGRFRERDHRPRAAANRPVDDGRRPPGAVGVAARPAGALSGCDARADDRLIGWTAALAGWLLALAAGVEARRRRRSSRSTRPTTPRTPGRCSTTATCATTGRRRAEHDEDPRAAHDRASGATGRP